MFLLSYFRLLNIFERLDILHVVSHIVSHGFNPFVGVTSNNEFFRLIGLVSYHDTNTGVGFPSFLALSFHPYFYFFNIVAFCIIPLLVLPFLRSYSGYFFFFLFSSKIALHSVELTPDGLLIWCFELFFGVLVCWLIHFNTYKLRL